MPQPPCPAEERAGIDAVDGMLWVVHPLLRPLQLFLVLALLTTDAHAAARFLPARHLTRAEFLELVLGKIHPRSRVRECARRYQQLFPDVLPRSWLNANLCLGVEEGLVHRRPGGEFRPDEPVRLRDVAGVLLKAFGPPRDRSDGSSLTRLVRLGVVPPSISDPELRLTRGQVEEVIVRLRHRGLRRPAARAAPVGPVGPRLRLPILVFHQILDVAPGSHGWPNSYSPGRFERMLEFFADNRIETLTFADLGAIQDGHRRAPDRGVVLTFDDGYRNQYRHARRLLNRYGMKGSFAVVTDTLGTGLRHMSWDQVATLLREGHEICSHTLSHGVLPRLSRSRIREELVRSRRILEEELLRPIDCLVYPYGRYDRRVVEIAREAGYRWARRVGGGTRIDLRRPLRLPGIGVPPDAGSEKLRRWFPVRPEELWARSR